MHLSFNFDITYSHNIHVDKQIQVKYFFAEILITFQLIFLFCQREKSAAKN